MRSRVLTDILGAEIWLKFENLQFTASFKERGALNRLMRLSEAERAAGVVAVSAGNHAQGLAYHAQRLGIRAVIVMPQTAPGVKVQGVRRFGAEVVLHGATFADAAERLEALKAERGLTLVHPFDDADVIAGQGTVALEMLEDAPDLDVLCVPIGGGGLMSGIAIAAKALKPGIELYGVQSELYPAMARAIGHDIPLNPGGPSVAEGIAVKEPGLLTRRIVADLVNDVLIAPEIAIEDAVAMLLEIEKTLAEGAGAAGIAAIAKHPAPFRGRKVGVVICGGNIDTQILASVLDRSLARRGRLVRLAVTSLDIAGALARVARIIGEHGGNIREVRHDRTFSNPWAKTTTIFIDLELIDPAETDPIITALQADGFGAQLASARVG
jgi:threonine dehydratase